VTREVLEEDENGNPTVVVYRETDDERQERQAERDEQEQRAHEVAASLRSTTQSELTPA